MDKTLGNTGAKSTSENVKDVVFWGNGDTFQLLVKVSSEAEGWMKSTKAMETGAGCIVQVTTQQRNPDGSYALAEAITFVPGVIIIAHHNEDKELVSRSLMTREQFTALDKEVK